MRDDEFYTGYLPEAPPGIARWIKGSVVLLFILAIAIPLTLVQLQNPFSKAAFEFGVVRDFEGVIRQSPVATLEVTRPAAAHLAAAPPGGPGETPAAVSRYYLVNPFKHGADVSQYDGQRVRVRASLIYRDDQTMLEILPDQIEALGDVSLSPEPKPERHYGDHTLTGRIVDSKCYLGIMKPGSTKPHRACAVRCISGGIPPLFLIEAEGGGQRQMLLVGQDGQAVNHEVLDYVDEPLEITGAVVRVDDLWILKADPATYRRL